MAKYVSVPKLGVLTQGTLFTCAAAEDYVGCNVRGLIITARCDIAQNKAAVFNYLPVVSLDDWIHRDGRMLLCARLLKDIQGRMRRSLKSANYSESIMLTQSPADILSTLFPATKNKAAEKARTSFETLVHDHQEILAAYESDPSESYARTIGNKYTGERTSLIRELIYQNLNGFYFLPSISPNDPEDGHVVLLREIRHIPRDLATKIAEGISSEEYSVACKEREHFSGRLSFEKEQFGMPIGLLQSPHIEHLMQVFSILFSRIGLPDPDQSLLDGIWSSLRSVGEQ